MMDTKQKNIKVVVRTKLGIMVQVWDHGCEYDQLIKRVNLPESQLKWFERKMAKFGYTVEIEEPALADWIGYYYDLLREKRNTRRRLAYYRKKHPEEAKSSDTILDMVLSSILPKSTIDKLNINNNKFDGKTIKFRRYKKDETK